MDPTNIVSCSNVNLLDDKGMNALHHAAINNDDIEVFSSLIQSGVLVDKQDNYFRTPLICAISYKNEVEIVKMLVNNGANVNFVFSGVSPLLLCAKHYPKNHEILNFMI